MNLGAMLKDRNVLVTGASGGLGAHFAGLSARCGARVTLAARRASRLEALSEQLTDAGAAGVEIVELDVADHHAVERAIAAISQPIDVIVNNAGINEIAPAIDQDIAVFDRVLSTNLRGAWSVAQAGARRWKAEGRGGTIINIASILEARLLSGLAPYAISKAGLKKMTEALALEWARFGIRVNAISPGYVATDINAGYFESPAGQAMVKRIPLRRFGEPSDLDAPFLLLATEASRWMTGTMITVDGGHSLATL